jgi:hypothetical protein
VFLSNSQQLLQIAFQSMKQEASRPGAVRRPDGAVRRVVFFSALVPSDSGVVRHAIYICAVFYFSAAFEES